MQSWLYFGLLREVLGPNYTPDRSISRSDNCVHTNELIHMALASPPISRLQNASRWLTSRVRFMHEYDISLEQQSGGGRENKRIRDLLDFAWAQCDALDSFRDSPLLHPDWPVLLLSIRLLIHRIRQACEYPEGSEPLSAFPSWDALSMIPIRQHMLHPGSGWCRNHCRSLVSRVSCSTLFYLANLRRAPRVRHQMCKEQKRCAACNTDDDNFVRPHRGDCRQCGEVYPLDFHKMRIILKKRLIPVVECIRDIKSGKLQLDYVVATPGSSYAAIAHLWADGLGNKGDHSIYECQLERIYKAVRDADRAIADHGPRLDKSKKTQSTWTESLAVFFRRLGRFDFLRNTRWKRATPVYFWLDVYCVPIEEAERNVDLNRMTTTYSWANYVLVLDHELHLVSNEMDYVEFASRVAVSGWNSRSWTYQEYCMGRTLVFETGDGPKMSYDIGMDGSIGHPSVASHASDTDHGYAMRFNDLGKLIFRPHLAAGGRIRGDDKYNEQERSENFTRIWDLLRNKTTTKLEDAISIFAMLLDLNPAEIRDMQSTLAVNEREDEVKLLEARLKAIVKTFTALPLDYLFISPRSIQSHLQRQWTPSEPHGPFDIGRLANCELHPESRVLKIRNSVLNPLHRTSLLVVHISNIRHLNCGLLIRGEDHISSAPVQRWMRLPSNGDVPIESSDAIVLLNEAQPTIIDEDHATQSFNGACLILSDSTNSNEIRASSIHPILWGCGESRSHETTYSAVEYSIGLKDIVIEFGQQISENAAFRMLTAH